MVSVLERDCELRQRAWDAAASVVDPEIPVLTIADLGVLREVAVAGDHVEVAITPTYSGCPAMNMIALEIELALERAGFSRPKAPYLRSPRGACAMSSLPASHTSTLPIDRSSAGRTPATL